jgi:hypothetical protein
MCNPELDEAMDQARELPGSDEAGAERLCIEAQKSLMNDADAVCNCDMKSFHCLRCDIKGYVDRPAHPHSFFW